MLYFQSQTSWCFLFVAIFITSATNNRIQTNLKISKQSNIIAFELKHSSLLQQNIEGRKNLTPKPKFELHDKKYVQGTRKCVWFKWFFELCEFELKEFSCKALLVNSGGTDEFARFSWSFELQEFELLEFNCSVTNSWHQQKYQKEVACILLGR